MGELFLKILNMSIAASWLILAVVLLRLVLKKAPKWISCVLWALVAVRLICPISFECAWSLIPNAEPIPSEIFMAQPPESHSNAIIDPIINPNLPKISPVESEKTIDMLQTEHIYVTLIWMAGVTVMVAYAVFGYIQLRHRVKASIRLKEHIWLCDEIATPFLLGFFSPRIYIPSGTEESQIVHIIAHEKAHLRRKDHWWKPLGYLVLAIHWFNPLVWVAYILLCRDIELACDEKVVRDLGKEESIAYSEALLSCSVNRRTILVCPLAFGEVGVKERVNRVLNYKKPAFWIVVIAVVASMVLAVCFLTNPNSFPVEFDSVQIAEASTMDFRTNNGPTTFRLSAAEIDELSSRMKDLKVGRKDQHLQGHTPFYSLYVDTDKNGRITFSSFNSDGSLSAVLYENAYYRISDSGFISYLQRMCSGETRAEANEQATASQNDLDSAISAAITEHYAPDKPDGLIHVESHAQLFDKQVCGVQKVDGDSNVEKVTVYLLVLHESFRPDSDPTQPLESVGGDYIPAVLTFRLGEGGDYLLEEYWEPGMGSDYAKDIKEKFPEVAEQQVWNDEEILTALQEENQEKVHTALQKQGSFEELADGLIHSICRSSNHSSNPQDYIHKAQKQYDELRGYGEATLRYCFRQFLAGSQTDLDGHIMAELCRDIMADRFGMAREDVLYETGQAWFDQFYANAQRTAEAVSLEELEKYHPVSKLLLDMTEENLKGENLFHGQAVSTYSFKEKTPTEEATIILYDDGKFELQFSPLSSYFGIGRYIMADGRLTLDTSNGKFTYVFEMADDTLVFDADASSDMVWYSGLEDGSVLYLTYPSNYSEHVNETNAAQKHITLPIEER